MSFDILLQISFGALVHGACIVSKSFSWTTLPVFCTFFLDQLSCLPLTLTFVGSSAWRLTSLWSGHHSSHKRTFLDSDNLWLVSLWNTSRYTSLVTCSNTTFVQSTACTTKGWQNFRLPWFTSPWSTLLRQRGISRVSLIGSATVHSSLSIYFDIVRRCSALKWSLQTCTL